MPGLTLTKELPPFLKWAGGKRWLITNHSSIFPENYSRYIEPFLGSGAVFFHLKPSEAIISDSNLELIDTYRAIKENPDMVERELKVHHKNHCQAYYYFIRSYNPRSAHKRAARFIYLNRTCWNGLYRVNLSGKFNVPIGTKNNVTLDTDNFKTTSAILRNADIRYGDFEQIIDEAKENDLVFVDPPYTVNHNHNGFIKYNEKIFTWSDQIRLKDCLCRAKQRGAKIVSTNAAHASVKNLYKNDFNITEVSRMSVIGSRRDSRGNFEELIIQG